MLRNATGISLHAICHRLITTTHDDELHDVGFVINWRVLRLRTWPDNLHH